MASKARVIYTGMTNALRRRVLEHKTGRIPGFTEKYKVHRLVYFESWQYVHSAIAREKEIKHWTRQRRVERIESTNPTWEDLAENLVYYRRISGRSLYSSRNQVRSEESSFAWWQGASMMPKESRSPGAAYGLLCGKILMAAPRDDSAYEGLQREMPS